MVVVAVTVVVGALAGDGVVVAVLLSLQLPKSIRDWTSTDGFGDDAYIRVLRFVKAPCLFAGSYVVTVTTSVPYPSVSLHEESVGTILLSDSHVEVLAHQKRNLGLIFRSLSFKAYKPFTLHTSTLKQLSSRLCRIVLLKRIDELCVRRPGTI